MTSQARGRVTTQKLEKVGLQWNVDDVQWNGKRKSISLMETTDWNDDNKKLMVGKINRLKLFEMKTNWFTWL